jgi:DNA-binding HxlR family transcriptional regulator
LAPREADRHAPPRVLLELTDLGRAQLRAIEPAK